MKKFAAILLVICLILSSIACGKDKSPSAMNPTTNSIVADDVEEPSSVPTEEPKSEPEVPAVEEAPVLVDITIDVSYFEGIPEDMVKAAAKEKGYHDCKINEDGSVTYTMTTEKRSEFLAELTASFEETILTYTEGDGAVASFAEIKHSEDFSEFDIFVDPALYSDWESMYAVGFFGMGYQYQSYSGIAEDEIDVVVRFIDNVSLEVLETDSYKEFIGDTAA